MKSKLKICGRCNKETILWKSKSRDKDGNVILGLCKDCATSSGVNVSEKKDKPVQKRIKPKKRKTTGEFILFMQIYAERKGICQITGESIQFDVNCFAHILGKGAYPSLRLEPENILLCKKEIHHLYDNSSREKLLEKYPGAKIIYELKDQLRYKYYNK